jgi:hypothetical protein
MGLKYFQYFYPLFHVAVIIPRQISKSILNKLYSAPNQIEHKRKLCFYLEDPFLNTGHKLEHHYYSNSN